MPPPSRLNLAIAAVAIQWLAWVVLPAIVPGIGTVGMLVGLLGGVAVLVWWLFLSRVPHLERWGAMALIGAAIAFWPRLLHPSIAKGMMGMMFALFVVPNLSLALTAWAAASRYLGATTRRVALVGAILAACALWLLARTEGVNGDGRPQLAWRWQPDAEELLLARPPVAEPPPPAPTPPAPTPVAAPAAAPVPAIPEPLWPGFRGPHRDGAVTAARIGEDWTAAPPVKLWSRSIGPGWSSFAVGAGLIYTQEQRGESEVVACYDAATGKPVWSHRDAARFWESNAGAGPRGTPALHRGRVYTLGATGIVNALDARTGSLLWTRNGAADTEAKRPDWGFSGSPLVIGDVVVVPVSGHLAAYDAATGNPRWIHKEGGGGYSSPHLANFDGVPQILFLNNEGVSGLAPADGKALWNHKWSGGTILQPAVLSDGLLMAGSDISGGIGLRRLAVSNASGNWSVEEKWTSTGLKPYFNDFVVDGDHAYGFDGAILSCVDLRDGKRKWKGGRYGHGQMLLFAAQHLLVVLSEEGELALVKASPGEFTEVAKVPAIEGKTWNHPVAAGQILLVRNGQEMAAFRLPKS